MRCTPPAPGKCVAYADTPGAQYSPVNVAANRAAAVVQPGGLSDSRMEGGAGLQPSAWSLLLLSEGSGVDVENLDPHHQVVEAVLLVVLPPNVPDARRA